MPFFPSSVQLRFNIWDLCRNTQGWSKESRCGHHCVIKTASLVFLNMSPLQATLHENESFGRVRMTEIHAPRSLRHYIENILHWKTRLGQSKLMKPQMGNCCYPQPAGSINEQFCPHPLPGKKTSPFGKLVSSVLVWRECHFGNPLQRWAFSEHTPQPRDQFSQMEGCHLLRRHEGNLPT